MDGSAKEITFDKNGVCNFCITAKKMLKQIKDEKHRLPIIINQIKKDGTGNDYDVIIGLSGGVDSSVSLHHIVQLGLRPLCFNVDNGYNDKKADENVMKLVETLKVPFYRYVIDLEKFRELQAAFIRAGVPNIEIPTDHILMATSFEMAKKHNVKWIISGGNVATESIMPISWGYNPWDLRHIQDVYRKFTGRKLNGLPLCNLFWYNWYKWVKRIKTFYILDYVDYNRADSIKMLEEKYLYQDYHEKHCENLFTWWFQNYYLFEKFGYDKRKPHLSSLINSGQIERKEALYSLADRPVYPGLGLEGKVLKYPKRSHYEFKTNEKLWKFITIFVRACRRLSRKLTRIGIITGG
jgi:N-acetyl sugar amidotransferase